jgi:hypothetical protein
MGNSVDQNERTVQRDDRGRWLKGTPSPSPGRGMTNRQRIAEKLIADISEVWESHGKAVLLKLARDDPAKLASIAYGLLPKDIFISVAPATPGSLDPDEWKLMIDLVKLIKAAAPDGANALPSEIVPAIEETVRAHFAKPIE